MNRAQPFSNINLRPRTRHVISPRLVAVVIGGVCLVAIRRFIPLEAQFWVLLPLVLLNVWVSTYGWRRAVGAIHESLDRLENIS